MQAERDRFEESFNALADIGRDPNGGWTRLSWTDHDMAAREWFRSEATRLNMAVETDGNGNLWAYWGTGERVVATGSHLDTVINGGAFDGALGVVSGFHAVELLQGAARSYDTTIAVAAFVEEEGAGFGRPTLGSRLMVGSHDPNRAAELQGRGGVPFAKAMEEAGVSATDMGPDPDRVGRLDAMIELHIEQGRGLGDTNAAVGRITGIWPHGRWRATITGAADHAGAARLEDRTDPMLAVPTAVLAARRMAETLDCRATVGRIEVEPNTTNTVPEQVSLWLDVRAAEAAAVATLVDKWSEDVADAARAAGARTQVHMESLTDPLFFSDDMAAVIDSVLDAHGIDRHPLPTAAGHDAGILSDHVPTGMIHVRNPDGTSHAPSEHASVDDCLKGVEVLSDVLDRLAVS